MGDINLLAILLAAAAFAAVTAIWYGALFRKAWARAARIRPEQLRRRNTWLVFGLIFLLELLVCLMLGHQYARSDPSPRGMMMIATGFGATIMAPALGIHYLLQRRSGKLFAIDAGHLVVGMTAAGLVFLLLRQSNSI